MHKIRRIYRSLFCALFCLILCSEATAYAKEPQLTAIAAVVLDGDSGRVLYGKQENEIRPMASTTKIMTAILVLEHCEPDEEAVVSKEAAMIPPVKLGCKAGETYPVQDLLYAMLLESDNDTAYVLGEHVGKKVNEKAPMEAFLRLMNEKAKELGCSHTTFATPNGLDGEIKLEGQVREHGTTAAELARIMQYCLYESPKREEFVSICQTQNYSFRANNRYFCLTNHNALFTMRKDVIAGKTGFTCKAGYCYIAAVEKDEKKLIIALLGCGWPGQKSAKWKDTQKLITYVDQLYQLEDISSCFYTSEALQPIPVIDGKADNVSIRLGEVKGSNLVLLQEGEQIQSRCEIQDHIAAPVMAGTMAGEITYYVGDTLLCTQPVYYAEAVEKRDFEYYLEKVWKVFWKSIPFVSGGKVQY